MSSRGMKTAMISQQDAMIPQTETPPFGLLSTNTQTALELLPATVRFLRCGCPSVQWLIITPSFDDEVGRTSVMTALTHALRNMKTSGENFLLASPKKWVQGEVITITRTVAPKGIDTSFARLKVGDEFLALAGGRWMKLVDGDSEKAVLLEDFVTSLNVARFARGHVERFEPNAGVLKIIK